MVDNESSIDVLLAVAAVDYSDEDSILAFAVAVVAVEPLFPRRRLYIS